MKSPRKILGGIGPFCLAIILLTLLTRPASAHKREWLQTYPYWTAVKGEIEFEQWHNAGDEVSEEPEEWFELEYGVTPRFQTSFYVVTDRRLNYKAFKWENIYRLAEPGEFFVDPALYVEYKNQRDPGRPNEHELEGKIILQKYFGELAVASNFVFEKQISPDEPLQFNRFHVALSHPLGTPDVSAGLEFTRYVHEGISSLTPGVYASLRKNMRIGLGYELPISGIASGRLRTLFELEF